MGVVRTILLIAFIIICVLLVLLVMVQNENSNGMGSAFGGGNSAAFGSHSASVLTKTTGVLVGLFFVVTFVLALLTKAPSKDTMSTVAEEVNGVETVTEEVSSGADWLDEALGTSGEASSEAELTVPQEN